MMSSTLSYMPPTPPPPPVTTAATACKNLSGYQPESDECLTPPRKIKRAAGPINWIAGELRLIKADIKSSHKSTVSSDVSAIGHRVDKLESIFKERFAKLDEQIGDLRKEYRAGLKVLTHGYKEVMTGEIATATTGLSSHIAILEQSSKDVVAVKNSVDNLSSSLPAIIINAVSSVPSQNDWTGPFEKLQTQCRKLELKLNNCIDDLSEMCGQTLPNPVGTHDLRNFSTIGELEQALLDIERSTEHRFIKIEDQMQHVEDYCRTEFEIRSTCNSPCPVSGAAPLILDVNFESLLERMRCKFIDKDMLRAATHRWSSMVESSLARIVFLEDKLGFGKFR